MTLHKSDYINLAKSAVNTAIKNSDIAAPYIPQKQYQKAVIGLNVLYFLLHLADKKGE